VGCCSVEIKGTDGKNHLLTIDAASAFDAVNQAIQRWSMLWWWDPDVVAIVKRNDESWNISVKQVIRWAALSRRP
jgi:hypothetical protein